jgi:hypothetical protein
MNVGYLSVIQEQSGSYVNWSKLDDQETIETSTYFRHIRFKKPIAVKMDGKKRISVITINND